MKNQFRNAYIQQNVVLIKKYVETKHIASDKVDFFKLFSKLLCTWQ